MYVKSLELQCRKSIPVSPLGFRKKQGMSTKKNRALKPPKTGEIRANQGAKNRKTGTFFWHTLGYIFKSDSIRDLRSCIVLYYIALYCIKRDNYPMLPQIMWKFGMMLAYIA